MGSIPPRTSSFVITNSTVTANDCGEGGALNFASHVSPVLVNSIIWNNEPQQIVMGHEEPAEITLAYTDIENGQNGLSFSNLVALNWLEGNLDADPLFLDTTNADFRLQTGSPCIDVGTTCFVWNGDTLVNISPIEYIGAGPDLGAFEYDPQAVRGNSPTLPEQITLQQNYPNPFNPATMIEFSLPSPREINLCVYNLLGQEVTVLAEGRYAAGIHRVMFDALHLPSGIYIYRLTSGQDAVSRKMVLVR